jgi:hypothetical protein
MMWKYRRLFLYGGLALLALSFAVAPGLPRVALLGTAIALKCAFLVIALRARGGRLAVAPLCLIAAGVVAILLAPSSGGRWAVVAMAAALKATGLWLLLRRR